MNMEIRYSKDAQKAINMLDAQMKGRIRKAITNLTLKPPVGNIKPMQGKQYKDCFRVRVGQYRIIYRYGQEGELQILFIIKVGPRGDIYK